MMHANPVDSHHEVEDLLPTESDQQSTSFTQSSHVHFLQRSQSLPAPSSADRHHGITRIRYLSGRTSIVTLQRMRIISTRTFSSVAPGDENQLRGNWDSPIEFFLSCLGYAVGLGNIWRFPYLVYRNGGGAFLIPYTIMLLCCGLPMMFMELALGQYSSEGPLTVWKLSPIFKGIGIGMVTCSTILVIYYNLITAWGLYYLYLSISSTLPWSCCDDRQWSDERCVSFADCGAVTNNQHLNTSTKQSAADQFFHRNVLRISDGLSQFDSIHPHLLVSLLVAWLIVFAVIMKGIKSIGKTVYFTSTFPYLILAILLIRTVIEPGAIDGIAFYLRPNMSMLLEARVWSDAAGQIFYSTGVCFGGTITLASYNRFRNNIYRDALIVTIGNSLTSVFGGFVVFSILGLMAHRQNSTIAEVVTSGPGLTFIAYPQAVTILPWAPLWSALFFLMLVTLALSTQFPTVESIGTSIVDQFPGALRPYHFWVTLALCTMCFLLGLPLTTSSGMYLLQLLDTYGVGNALLILGIFEVGVVAWRYGATRLIDNVEAMIGWRPHRYWYYMWTIVTPALLVFAIAFQFVQAKSIEYGEYRFPRNATYIGWLLTCIPLAPIPIYAIYSLIDHRRSLKHVESLFTSLRILSAASTDWAPALKKYHRAPAPSDLRMDDDDNVFTKKAQKY